MRRSRVEVEVEVKVEVKEQRVGDGVVVMGVGKVLLLCLGSLLSIFQPRMCNIYVERKYINLVVTKWRKYNLVLSKGLLQSANPSTFPRQLLAQQIYAGSQSLNLCVYLPLCLPSDILFHLLCVMLNDTEEFLCK